MKKSASILDYSYPYLDPAVWDQEMNLFVYQKDFILRLINTMYETYDLKQSETWVEDIVVIGSLTTSKWLLTSDLDVHIRVNLDAFIASNMPGSTKDQAFEKLDLTRKEFDRAKILAPMTQHPTEFYFESVEFKPSNIALVGVYSLMQDAWLKEPVIFEADLDFEESKKDVVAQAEALAEELDGSLGKIQRDIQRVNELEEVIKAWGHDKQQLFYAKVEAKLAAIEAEILKDLQIKQELVDARHSNQDAMSEIEVKFKWLARFGFFGILSNLKTLLEQTGGTVTTQELPLIEKIISQGSLGSAGQWWFDPSAKLYKVDLPSHNHTEWIQQNAGMENINQAIEKGWIRSRKDGDKAVIHLESLQNIPDFIYDFILKLDADITFIEDIHDNYVKLFREDIIELGPQKAVNKALSQKRMGSIKEAGQVTRLFLDGGQEVRVYKNPTPNQAEQLFNKAPEHVMRAVGTGTDVYMWNAFDADHYTVMEKMGLLDAHGGEMSIYNSNEAKEIASRFYNKKQFQTASIKEAFLKEAFEENKECETQIAIDFDGTVAKERKFPNIGEPEKEVKEALSKLKEMGYDILIYSCRSRDEEGLELIREYLDKHEIPYDSIFEGDKPFAKFYIDNRAIHFDNWNNVLKTVEKSEKKASLAIVAAPVNLPTIDPKTLGRKEPYALFIGTGDYGSAGKIDMFNVYGEHPMITKSNALPTVTLDTLIQNNIPVIGKEPRAGEKQPFQDISGIVKQAFSKIDLVAKTKKVKQGDYSCLMALVPHDLAQEIVEWGVRNVPDEDLYLDEDGNLGRELESHITIKYGLLTNDAKHVRRSFNDDKPFHAKLGKVRHFQPPELPFDVLTVEIISEDLQKANAKICDKFDCAEGLVSDEYKPHITIAYMKRDKAHEYVGYEGFKDKEVELDTVIFSPHKGNRTYFSVSQDKESAFILEKLDKKSYTYKIGDKVRDISNGKTGIIKEIIGKEVVLEEVL